MSIPPTLNSPPGADYWGICVKQAPRICVDGLGKAKTTLASERKRLVRLEDVPEDVPEARIKAVNINSLV